MYVADERWRGYRFLFWEGITCAFRAANYMGHGGITVQWDVHAPTIEMYCRNICVHCHQIANLHGNDKVWCTL